MSILDWLFIGCLSAAILLLIVSLPVTISCIQTRKKYKILTQKRVKNKRKQKKLQRKQKKLESSYKRQLRLVVILPIIGLLLVGAGFYARYYQATNLGERDSGNLVQGYYLISEIDTQLANAEKDDNKVKLSKNIKELSGRLSSYGARRADGRLTLEGQNLLNRQYQLIKEIGLNLAVQPEDFLEKPEKIAEFKQDIEKAKDSQQKVIKYFSINESALKAKK